MYVVTVLFALKPEHLARFRAAMARQAEASRRAEPDCLQFDVCYDPETPAQCFLYEVYRDAAAFRAHLATAHFKAFDAETSGWIESKEVRCYERAWPPAER